MAGLPAWVGWPGTGPAPGHGWLPGPALRFAILLLAYAFLALSLTVNYAASVTFFLLAMIGMYVGLRRGFVNGLTRAEKLVMVAFAAYPAVAIISYLVGTQTNVGFRFLGRDLRFLLFIPIYLAVRWSRPKVAHVGWALAGGATGACILAALQTKPWPAPMPHGVTGTHITFGDLSILSGFLAAALLFPPACKWRRLSVHELLRAVVALVAPTAGMVAGVLSQARGGWPTIPVLTILLLWLLPATQRIPVIVRIGATALVLTAVVGAAWLIPGMHHRLALARRNVLAYLAVANAPSVEARCVDRITFLRALLLSSKKKGSGTVTIVRLSAEARTAVAHFGCAGSYALALVDPQTAVRNLELRLYRGNGPSPRIRQSATIVARGKGSFNVGWKAPWVRVESPERWRRYSTSKSYDRISTANISVRPGATMLSIPVQEPAGAFAHALAQSSAGERLEMWRSAWAMFLEHPVLGVGTGSFRAANKRANRSSVVVRGIGHYQHAHSDYLNGLATKGTLGLLTFLGIVMAPYFAVLELGRRQARSGLIPSAIVVSVGIGIFGLTETLFVHSEVISWYATAAIALVAAAASRGAVRDKAAPSQLPREHYSA